MIIWMASPSLVLICFDGCIKMYQMISMHIHAPKNDPFKDLPQNQGGLLPKPSLREPAENAELPTRGMAPAEVQVGKARVLGDSS